MGEHLPCKQGVKGSNPSISIRQIISACCTLKTEYRNQDPTGERSSVESKTTEEKKEGAVRDDTVHRRVPVP